MSIVIEYDSFQTTDKSPFGAIQKLSDVCFKVKVHASDTIQKVILHVAQDGHWDTEHQVVMDWHDPYYCGEFTPNNASLYFYFFEVITANEQCFYGCPDGGYGGSGIIYNKRSDVQMYQLTVVDHVEPIPKWYRHGLAYQIFVDRFNNGNPDGHINNPKPNSSIYGQKSDLPMYIRNNKQEVVRWDFYGGNLRGIEAKLPYLKQLGVTMIYLSPIFEAMSNHRYDTGDYLKIDPVLGTLADFDHLVAAIHAAGMYVILDGVFNHVGVNSRYFNQSGYYDTIGAEQSTDSKYYPWFTFTKYPNEYDSWWGVTDLPTVNKSNLDFQKFIYGGKDSVIDYWTSRGIDGWRLDVADELPDEFIMGIRQALDKYPNKVLIGEVWEDASHKLAYGRRRHYLEGGMLQAVMNYPLRKLIIRVLTGDLKPSEWWLELMTLKENYPKTVFNYNFNNIGSHDTERILTMLHNNHDWLQQAFGLLFTMPGVPCLYYGDEAGLTGGKDPANRAYFPWDTADTVTQAKVKEWYQWRSEHSWINEADFAPFYLCDYGIGFVYWQNNKQVLVVLNTSPNSREVQTNDFMLDVIPSNLSAKIKKCLIGKTLDQSAIKVIEDF
ncbi:maltodextrin glucosidase [Companilactobacillus nodensis DSM 19682 = JCM 14932 = NBRC 107160]|uniref:Maltodextrin glucosidase n=1 Tax=Companilactobacillus nodensis DSM 19682 = JCM 14932 = NBRC 107160 TaxID=1423775 RepID=A0A0R1KCZ7_9LACO|nr:glycoside hydrolase family 13 protein [Companilactobacillus nodensis]KRK81227.1 maltodextrin glucosidase [Companilactobacillus nodensis DSM 19682 = JCM 14932 = NBRC 107160]